MIKLCIFTSIFSVIIGLIKSKKVLNPLTVFGILWGMIVFLSSLGLYGLKIPQDNTYFIIALGSIGFLTGYTIINTIVHLINNQLMQQRTLNNKNTEKNFNVRYKLIYVFSILAILLLLVDLVVILNNIDFNMVAIREMCQNPDSIIYARRTGIENAIRALIVLPSSFALSCFAAREVFEKNRNNKIIILYIIVMLLRVITEAGRAVIVYFILHVFVAFLFRNRKKTKFIYTTINLKWSISISFVFVAGVLALIYTTLLRSGDEWQRIMYNYISMQPIMLEQWMDYVSSNDLFAYGFASTNGFVYPIIYFVKNIFGYSEFPGFLGEITTTIALTDSQWLYIANEVRANAFISVFWTFFYDFREFGVIFGMMIYGFICAVSFNKVKKSMNARNIGIYMLIIQGILFSFIRMQFSVPTYALSFFYVLVLCDGGKFDEK